MVIQLKKRRKYGKHHLFQIASTVFDWHIVNIVNTVIIVNIVIIVISWSTNSTYLHLDFYLLSWRWWPLWSTGTLYQWSLKPEKASPDRCLFKISVSCTLRLSRSKKWDEKLSKTYKHTKKKRHSRKWWPPLQLAVLYVYNTDILKRHRSWLPFSGFRDHWYKVPLLHRGHHRQRSTKGTWSYSLWISGSECLRVLSGLVPEL